MAKAVDGVPRRNVDVLSKAVEHFNRHGEPAWELLDPDLTFVTRGDVEASITYRGHAGMTDALAAFADAWERITWEVREVVEADDVLVATLAIHVRGRASGVELDLEETWATWMRNGRFVRIEQHPTREAGLAAAGLAESH